MTYKVEDIANKILSKAATSDSGELISNMKLQKLLYYMQGFHLAFFGTPLFDEDIEAWMYGPVVPSVYEKYKRWGNVGLNPDTDVIINLDSDEENLFDEVYKIYSEYSAIGLMHLTHQETPWRTTPTGVGNIIHKNTLRNFFKTRIE